MEHQSEVSSEVVALFSSDLSKEKLQEFVGRMEAQLDDSTGAASLVSLITFTIDAGC